MTRARHPIAIDRDRILQLHRQGLSAAVIATRLGCSRRAVHAEIQRRREAEAVDQGRAVS